MLTPTNFVLKTLVATLVYVLITMAMTMVAAIRNVTDPLQVFFLAATAGSAAVVVTLSLVERSTRPPAQPTLTQPDE